MIDLSEKSLLMIEPNCPAAPVHDVHTRRAYRLVFGGKLNRGRCWRGMHGCVCGASSEPFELITPQGRITNSLFCHYVECHRPDVPDGELIKLYAESMSWSIAEAEANYCIEEANRVDSTPEEPTDPVVAIAKRIDSMILARVLNSLKERESTS